jgi:8-oxo-dGTP pyrophosphatase MutT (NUDIX family)
MRFPVSVKGVVEIDGRVPLLRNERSEWELPGGRLELGEDLEATAEREVLEELGYFRAVPHARRCVDLLPGVRRRDRRDRRLRLRASHAACRYAAVDVELGAQRGAMVRRGVARECRDA